MLKSIRHTVYCLLMTALVAAFVACGGASAPEEPVSARSGATEWVATEQAPSSMVSTPEQATKDELAATGGPAAKSDKTPERAVAEKRAAETTTTPAPTSEPQGQVATDKDNQKPGKVEDDHVVDILRLLVNAGIDEFWSVNVAAISADPDLEPLLQNLVEAWEQGSKEGTEGLDIAIQEADFIISLPGEGIFLSGMEDAKELRESLTGLGYELLEPPGSVAYWSNASARLGELVFLSNGVVLVMRGQERGLNDTSLLDASSLVLYEHTWSDELWQQYKDERDGWPGTTGLDSMDDLAATIHGSLVFFLVHNGLGWEKIEKADGQNVKLTTKSFYEDEEARKVAEAEWAKQGKEKLHEELKSTFPDCPEVGIGLEKQGVTITRVCPMETTGLLYAGHYLDIKARR